MVATHSQLPGLPTASVSQSTSRSKRRPSYRRPSEKYSTSTASHRAGLTSNISSNTRNPQKIRSRSVCSGAQSTTTDHRRPSAPAITHAPRLSIADRFMASSFPMPSVPDIPQNPTSPTMTSLELQNSVSTDFPTTASSTTGRLSVAERFMNTESVSSPSDSSLNTFAQQQYRERSLSSFSGKTLQTMALSSFPPPEPTNLGRLTIAETFMKPNGSIHEKTGYETTHPLDMTKSSSPFDDPIDIQLHPPSDLSFPLDTGKTKRPWGSQDTLVYQQTMEKKKYGQYSDSRSVSSRDCLANAVSDYRTRHSAVSSDDLSTHLADEYTDVEMGYEKSTETCFNKEEEPPAKKAQVQPKKVSTMTPVEHYESNEIESVPGFWLGCCFISCRQPPVRKQDKNLYKEFHPKKRGGCGRRGWVICVFLLFIVLSLVVYFVWPITPLMRIEGATLTSPAKISQTTQGIMVGNVAFESDWLVNITVDNRKNHVPTRIVQIQVVAKDALTGLVIGKGIRNDDLNSETIVLAPNGISTLQLPIHVDYQARDSTDTTFLDLISACSPKHPLNTNAVSLPAGQHEALPLHFWITLHFFGLDWAGYKSTVIATPATGGFVCPQ
ncbi:hypothetical protein G6F56_005022 [Rhizopus delemar]|uniref:Uncharacterized protein n=1 Tax=Rhizopus stolonifer TaxID=4846 RepID=A0A367J8X8_RHIST|nr:hypothetical protein G6F56_005022 [Rhizopus delemar]RCH86370.1 hypothetical protein CU098_006703 [Rhizopus stolonifer]